MFWISKTLRVITQTRRAITNHWRIDKSSNICVLADFEGFKVICQREADKDIISLWGKEELKSKKLKQRKRLNRD